LALEEPAEPAAASPASPPQCGPNLSAFCAGDDVPLSFDHDPADRRMDRLMAALGRLEDAAPVFRSAAAVPRAGVLLAVAALLQTGVLGVRPRYLRQAHDPQGPCRATATRGPGDHRLLGQRSAGRSPLRRHRPSERGPGEDAADRARASARHDREATADGRLRPRRLQSKTFPAAH